MPPWPRVRRSSPVSQVGPNCCARAQSRARRSNPRSARRSSSASLTRAAPNAPGQLASHYAPKAELRLGAVDASADEAVLDFGGSLKGGAASARLDLSPSGDLIEAASHLFSYLRALDAARRRADCGRADPERMGLARRSTIGFAARRRPGEAEQRPTSLCANSTQAWEIARGRPGRRLRSRLRAKASAEMSGDRSTEP